MSGTRRLQKEFKDLQSSGIIETESVKNLEIDSQSILQWSGNLNPTKAPYDKGSFKFNINFPAEYPFKPPKVTLKTLIYHPNIDEKGQICLPIVAAENWKPATKVEHVLHALLGNETVGRRENGQGLLTWAYPLTSQIGPNWSEIV